MTAASYTELIKSIPGLVSYIPLDDKNKARDVVRGVDGTIHGAVRFAADGAHFDGKSYIEFPDDACFSPAGSASKEFTVVVSQSVEDWSKGSANGEYVHWFGKSRPNQHEWIMRIYMDGGGGEAAARKRRTSFYSFNPAGGLGTGSYFQDATDGSAERVIAGQISLKGTGPTPGYVQMVKNGVVRDKDNESVYNVAPKHTAAPLGIGGGANGGGLVGRIRRVAFFNRILTPAELKSLYDNRNLPENASAPTTQRPPTTQQPPTTTTPARSGAGANEVVIEDAKFAVAGVDRARAANELVIYTPKHGPSTGTNAFGSEATVVRGVVTSLQRGGGDRQIPDTGVVLSAHGTAKAWLEQHAKVGAAVTLPAGLTQPSGPPAADLADAKVLRGQASALRATKGGAAHVTMDKALELAAAVLDSAATELET